MADPRKLDHKNPKNKDLGVERRNFTPELSRKNTKGRKGQGEAMMKTKTMGPKILKENLLKALELSLGVVTTACRAVGCSRDMHYSLMNSDPDYEARYNELSEVALDFVESQLFSKIRERDSACIIYYLKTKGRKRGYIEKVENEHRMLPSLDLTKLTDEELMLFTNLQMKMEGQSGVEIIK